MASSNSTSSSQMHTIIVKAAPLFATILWRWFGKLAIPIGDALSAVGGAILSLYMFPRKIQGVDWVKVEASKTNEIVGKLLKVWRVELAQEVRLVVEEIRTCPLSTPYRASEPL